MFISILNNSVLVSIILNLAYFIKFIITVISRYALSDLGDSSNPIGSFFRTMT